jgi:kinesin family protein 15
MVGRLGGSLWHTPGRPSESGAGDSNNAPDTVLAHVAAKGSGAASTRHRLLDVLTPVTQFKRKLKLPVETPLKSPSLSRVRRPPPRGEETPSRVSAATPRLAVTVHSVHRAKTAGGGSVQRKPASSTLKPGRASGGLKFAARGQHATAVNSEEVPHYQLQDDPSFWMENNVQVCTCC